MNKKHILIFGVGAILGAVSMSYLKRNKKSNKTEENQKTIKLGDKSKLVEQLQEELNKILPVKSRVEVTGAYDKTTRDAVSYLFGNRGILNDEHTGEIKEIYIKNMSKK